MNLPYQVSGSQASNFTDDSEVVLMNPWIRQTFACETLLTGGPQLGMILSGVEKFDPASWWKALVMVVFSKERDVNEVQESVLGNDMPPTGSKKPKSNDQRGSMWFMC
jgi:hypothetical protein